MFFEKSFSMMRTTSSLRSRTAFSGSAGAATTSTPVCCFSQETKAGAYCGSSARFKPTSSQGIGGAKYCASESPTASITYSRPYRPPPTRTHKLVPVRRSSQEGCLTVMYRWWPPALTAVSAGLSGLAGSKESAGASGSGSGWIAIHGAPEGGWHTPSAIPSEHIRGAADLKGAAEVKRF